MKRVSSIITGAFQSDDRAPCLLPSLNNGGGTASQSGTTITVTTANPHNIPSAAANAISNTGVKVYLSMAAGTILSGWFSNIIITSTNQFTCESTISQTVASQTVNGLGANNTPITPLAIIIPPNTTFTGSRVEIKGFIEYPGGSVVASRDIKMYLGPNSGGVSGFNNNQTTSITGSNTFIYSKLLFLNDIADSSYIGISSGGPGSGNVLTKRVAAGHNIKPSAGFSIIPYIYFGAPVTNDYVLYSMLEAEVGK